MSELRKDPIHGRWVIIASERAKRPSDFHHAQPDTTGRLCPFCPGHEDLTPQAIRQLPPTGPWQLRVFPNKYPALRVEGELSRDAEGLFDRMTGVGAHEVIVETARHDETLADLSVPRLAQVLETWAERVRDLSRDERLRHVLVFKNHGAAAGATVSHAHSQLVALPIVPALVHEELQGAWAHFQAKERCIYCDVIRQEHKDQTRLVYENDGAVAFCPWASRTPFETWIMPRQHQPHFESEPAEVLRQVADALSHALKALDVALDHPAYNLIVHTAPVRERGLLHYHWHIEIVPAVARLAGFEIGTGYHINTVAPEEAARVLRTAHLPGETSGS